MSSFKCPRSSFDPGAHAWSVLSMAAHKWKEHQIQSRGVNNGTMRYFPSQDEYEVANK